MCQNKSATHCATLQNSYQSENSHGGGPLLSVFDEQKEAMLQFALRALATSLVCRKDDPYGSSGHLPKVRRTIQDS
jgi:hypothetical protein